MRAGTQTGPLWALGARRWAAGRQVKGLTLPASRDVAYGNGIGWAMLNLALVQLLVGWLRGQRRRDRRPVNEARPCSVS